MLLELVTVASGLILPRLFIGTFGSEVNGLVSSISSFIAYIVLLQSGVGTVAKAAMYKPLATQDHEKLCVIVKTVENFFRKIAYLTVVYIVLLCVLFPTIITPDAGDFIYTASLVVIIGVSTAAQYFFGITHQMLLEADQRSYVYSVIQIITIVVNTILSIILIKAGCSVQVVKFGSAVIFVIRPIALSLYSRRKYRIDDRVSIDNSYIKQRWDGFAQAIAYFIHSMTDIFVLTIFSRFSSEVSLSLVSVYSVYNLILTGLTSFIRAIERAVTSALGNIIALGEKENLDRAFRAYNNFTHMVCTVVFAAASITIFKFIGVYVKDITDAEYVQYAFGYIIVAAEYVYCLRSTYSSVIYAAGKFKETKRSAEIEAGLNIIVSVILVATFGLIGVAVGTFVAMAYRAISFAIYLHKEVLGLTYFSQIQRYFISLVSYVASIVAFSFFDVSIDNYLQWILYGIVAMAGTTIIVLLFNFSFDKKGTLEVFRTFWRRKRGLNRRLSP